MPPSNIRVSSRLLGQLGLVEVCGEVDLATRDELDGALRQILDGDPQRVVVDLSDVRFLAAAGVHCLDRAARALGGRGGELHLICPDGSPIRAVLTCSSWAEQWSMHNQAPSFRHAEQTSE